MKTKISASLFNRT